ncbi:MAG: hypothetical protein KTR31_04940 [Myxococcales bacterium]|nr:hypothetical protein [Myxococcales bacterium]
MASHLDDDSPAALVRQMGERPVRWGWAWMLLVPVAVLVAPRLEPGTWQADATVVEKDDCELGSMLPLGVPQAPIPPTSVVEVLPPEPDLRDDVVHPERPGIEPGALLGTYVWDGCTLAPARLPEHQARDDLHVRTSYIPDHMLPGVLARIDEAGIQGLHLGFYTAPRSLEALSKRRELRYLTFEGDHLADATLAPLADLEALRMLEMGVRPYEANHVTDDGLRHLSTLRHLEYLGVHGFEGVRGPGLRYLAGLRSLRELELSYTQVDDDSLRYLADLEQLRTLSLQHTRVTDAGVGRLAHLPNLKTLDLRQTAVSPAVADVLATFPALEHVVLHHNLQFDVIEAVRAKGLRADGFGWIRGTVGCEHWPRG